MKQVRFEQNNREEERRLSSSGFVVDLRGKLKKKPAIDSNRQSTDWAKRLEPIKDSLLSKARLGRYSFYKKAYQVREKISWHHFIPPYFWPQRSRRRFISKLYYRRFSYLDWLRPSFAFVRQYLHQQKKTFIFHSSLTSLRQAWTTKKEKMSQPLVLRRRPKTAEELFYFLIILILLVLPFKVMSYYFDLNVLKDKILNRSQSGISSFLAGAQKAAGADWSGANSEFSLAGQDFLDAATELENINKALLPLASLSANPKIKLAAESQKLIAIGSAAASLGENLSAAFDSLFHNPEPDIVRILDDFAIHGRLVESDLNIIQKNLAEININNIPSDYQEDFLMLRGKVDELSGGLTSFITSLRSFREFLGLSQDKRYLLVFQNNTELRASGGFLGSYALVDLHNGKIKNLEVPGGGSYDTEAGLKRQVVAPAPLWLVNPQWHFWDCNWWPDWPTSARNIMWFYEKSDGPTVDGVISFTPTVIEDLLRIIGPIDLRDKYGLVIDADNFWENVQNVVESKDQGKDGGSALSQSNLVASSSLLIDQDLERNVSNKPKKIIGDLMAEILEILPQKLDKENLIKMLSLAESNLSSKQILFYFTDPQLQTIVSDHNWAGEMLPTSYDYLSVINTNIAGQKSDRVMAEEINLESSVLSDGSVINILTINRRHQGVKNEAFTGVRNVNWLRVYVPLGSQLLSASGFSEPDAHYFSFPEEDWEINPVLAKNENIFSLDPDSGLKIYQENGKTVFANWVMVDPGQSALITIKYRLPFKIRSSAPSVWWPESLSRWLDIQQSPLLPYSLLVQKQPGAKPSDFKARLIVAPNWPVRWRYPLDLEAGSDALNIDTSLDSDRYFALILQAPNFDIK